MNSLLYIDTKALIVLPYLIAFVIALCLAFIPANIAEKKGYSKVGFYFFGLAAFVPALIVACVLQDKAVQEKKDKQYDDLMKEVRELRTQLNKQDKSPETEHTVSESLNLRVFTDMNGETTFEDTRAATDALKEKGVCEHENKKRCFIFVNKVIVARRDLCDECIARLRKDGYGIKQSL